MYKMEFIHSEKIFLITMNEVTSDKERLTSDCFIDIKKQIKKINPINYHIIVDSRKLNFSQYHMVGSLMELIHEVSFKHIKLIL
jgi:hypothetical protein